MGSQGFERRLLPRLTIGAPVPSGNQPAHPGQTGPQAAPAVTAVAARSGRPRESCGAVVAAREVALTVRANAQLPLPQPKGTSMLTLANLTEAFAAGQSEALQAVNALAAAGKSTSDVVMAMLISPTPTPADLTPSLRAAFRQGRSEVLTGLRAQAQQGVLNAADAVAALAVAAG